MDRRASRRPRARKDRGRSRVGERFEAVVGPVAHGGHCIVRLPEPESRVFFTRHTLPGERVIVEITEGSDGDRFWRGDAISVLEAVADRVAAPCPVSGPGLCGGCDFQHVSLAAQRALKGSVVAEQLRRLAGLDVDVEVEAVPGDDEGLRWRTRMQWATTTDGQRGLRAHRSHRVVPVDDCLIAQLSSRAPTPGPVVIETVLGHSFMVEPDGFWQVHPGAPSVLVSTVLSMLDPQPGESVLDLYAGVGLFARFLADHVGPGSRLVAIEGDRAAVQHAQENLATHIGAVVECGSVEEVLAAAYDETFDLVVLDPPREGAKRKVVDMVVVRSPRAVAYVACDPAALARDVAIFAEHGYRLESIRAFDLFPMTHHVECVALLTR